ncbi:MAG: hypothetical protein LBQ42_07820, partial [Synergistaceae bacterium]|nr:hypothetical protein [Synergistaceae bacterium]
MVINNNIPALQTYNTVNATSNSLQKSIQKLSTGLRINSAADDAAGLAISEKMRAQVRGLDRAVANSQDGISMIQTAEGALSETHSILQRMRELSVQSANDTLTQQDRAYIQLEIDQLREEVTRIGNTTQFNKKKLLDGSAAALWSSDRLSTKVIVNGGLRSIDQFGQKSAAEGNFVVDVNATPGKAQVQKSDVFTIKHPDVIMGVSTNAQAGINGVYVNNLPAGDYQVTLESLEQRYKFRFGSNESATARYLAEHLQLRMVGVSNTTDYTGYSWEVIDINNNTAAGTAGALTLQLVDASGNDVASGKLVFNLSTGALDPTPAASTAIATLETAGIDAKSMSFGGAIDVTQFRTRERAANDTAATILDRGTTLKFALGVGDFKAAASFGQQASGTTGGWGTGGQATLTTAGAPGTGPNDLYALSALAGLMKAEGVTSYSVEISAAGGSSGQNTFGNASVATLKIGNQTITASGTVNLSAGNSAGGAVSFDLGSGKTLSFTVTGSAANLNTDDKLVFTVNTSGAAHDASANDTYSVGDYRQGLVFSNDTELDQTHTFTLRVAKDGIDNTAGTVKFNLWVDNAQGNPTSITFNRNTGSMVYNLSDGGVVKPINFSFGLGTLDITKMREGDEVTLVTGKLAQQVGRYGTTQNVAVDASKSKSNASVLMEVVGVSDVNESVDFKVTANILNTDGSTTTRVTNLTLYNKDIVLNSIENDPLNLLGIDLVLNLNLALPGGDLTDPATDRVSNHYKAGDKLVYNVTPMGDPNAKALTAFQIKGEQNRDWGSNWIQGANNDVTIEGTSLLYGVNAAQVNGQDVHLKNFYVNEKDGTVYTGDIVLTLAQDFSTKIGKAQAGSVLASFEAAYVGQVAKGDVKLRDLDKFWS